jgi:hypothetical protein
MDLKRTLIPNAISCNIQNRSFFDRSVERTLPNAKHRR